MHEVAGNEGDMGLDGTGEVGDRISGGQATWVYEAEPVAEGEVRDRLREGRSKLVLIRS